MTALKPSEVLAKAADLIEPEGAWTQNAYARGKSGRPVDPENKRYAVCWCAVGAISRIAAAGSAPWWTARRPLERVIGQSCLPDWNDTPGRTQAEVVAAFRAAAELAKAEGQ